MTRRTEGGGSTTLRRLSKASLEFLLIRIAMNLGKIVR